MRCIACHDLILIPLVVPFSRTLLTRTSSTIDSIPSLPRLPMLHFVTISSQMNHIIFELFINMFVNDNFDSHLTPWPGPHVMLLIIIWRLLEPIDIQSSPTTI